VKISLIAVGKRPSDWVQTGYEEYAKRLPPDWALRLIEIPAGKRGKNVDLNRLIQREGEQMLAAIPAGDWVVALTEHGQLWNNQQLARQIQSWQEKGGGLSLLVGGPEGLAPACLAKANLQWSLSSLTFPHPLVRILVAEQLYRCFTILQNHPYHR